MATFILVIAIIAQSLVGCSRGYETRQGEDGGERTPPQARTRGVDASHGSREAQAPSEPAPVTPEPEPVGAGPARCEDVGPLLVWRYSPTLSVLPDGKVLVAGGRHHDAYDYLRKAEIFDPATRTFAPTADLNEERAMHEAFPLPDGDVAVFGGLAKSIEIYDVESGQWRRDGRLRSEIVSFFADIMDDGTIYIAGGAPMSEEPYSSFAYLWDPRTRRLKAMPPLRPEGYSGSVFGRAGRELIVVSYPKFFGQDELRTLDTATGVQTPLSYSGPDPLLRMLSEDASVPIEGIIRGPNGQLLSPAVVLYEDRIERVEGNELRDVALLNRPHRAGAAVALTSGEIMVAGDIREENNMVELCRLPPVTPSVSPSPAPDRVVDAQPDLDAIAERSPASPLAPEDVGFVDGRQGRGWGDRCFLHLKERRYVPARAACERGLEIAVDDDVRGALHYNLGRIAEDSDDRVGALREYRRSLEFRPGNAAVRERIDALERR